MTQDYANLGILGFLFLNGSGKYSSTVRSLLSAVLGRTKFWSQKPRIIPIEVRIIEI